MTTTTVTFEVSADLRRLMDEHPEVNWSAVFREALIRHAKTLDIAKAILNEEEDRRIARMTKHLKRAVGARDRKAVRARRG